MSGYLSTLPLTDDEREAVRLYYVDGDDLRTISALTGLSVRAVRAATDRVAAMMTDQRDAAAEQAARPAATRPAPPRRRMARPARLPGAHTPPGPLLPVHELVPPTEARTVEVRPATAVRTVADAPPAVDDGPASPAWEHLATSPLVRAWAITDGWHVRPDAERVPGAIVIAYRNAHPGDTP